METTIITRSPAADETPLHVGIDSAGLTSNLRLMKESMRRSHPNMLVSGRHGGSASSSAGQRRNTVRSSSVSRVTGSDDMHHQSSTGSDGAAPVWTRLGSASSGSSVIDPATIRIMLRKRSSKLSLVSNESDGGGATRLPTRPFSAESTDTTMSATAEKLVQSIISRSPNGSPTPPKEGGGGGPGRQVSNQFLVRPARGSADAGTAATNGRGPLLIKQKTDSDLYAMKRPKSHYVGESVFQIDDHVYIGGIECAYNNNLLCRLNIEYIVDVSGLQPDQIPRSKRSDCPCLCQKATPHSRARMQIDLLSDTTDDLSPYFKQVNAFVDRARAVSKCVLISSYEGKNRCATFAVQYLMRFGRLDRDTAYERVLAANPRTDITDNFHRSLRRWELLLTDKSPIGNSNALSPMTKPAVTTPGGGGGSSTTGRPSSSSSTGSSGKDRRLGVPTALLGAQKRNAWT